MELQIHFVKDKKGSFLITTNIVIPSLLNKQRNINKLHYESKILFWYFCYFIYYQAISMYQDQLVCVLF